jgi:hypothetical protein
MPLSLSPMLHPKKILLLLFVAPGLYLTAQDKIDTALSILSERYPQEKIYLAFNKSKFVVGETIRMKGFVFSGYHISDISTNLYTELYNDHKLLISKKTFALINGVAEGGITISDSLPEGIYCIRAYTNWMLNFNEDFQSIQPILVYNPSSVLKLKTNDASWEAKAFVEGGTLLNNRLANIAVRLNSAGKLPQNWHGYLADGTAPLQPITRFQSLDKNVAIFQFVPEAGRQYKIIVEDSNGHSSAILLPPVSVTGVNLSVKQQDASLQYQIDFSNMPADEPYKIVGTIDNDIVYRATVINTDSTFVHSISTAQIDRGVLRLTLFNKNYQVVAERLCFLSPDADKKPVLDSLSLSSKTRSANQFNLQADSGKTYTVVVMDEKAANPFAENNLLSVCWLTGDFKNTIHDAGGYFGNNNSRSKEIIDALLITEKWHRFNWEEILNSRFPVIEFQKDNFLTYNATVYYKKSKLPNESISMVLFLPDSSRHFLQAKTDADGKFILDGLVFENNAKISYQLANKKLDNTALEIVFAPETCYLQYEQPLPVSNYTLAPNSSKEAPTAEIVQSIENLKNQQLSKAKFNTLNEVVLKAKARSATQLLDEKLSSGRFYNPRETVYDFVNEKQPGTEGSNLLYWLKGRIPGDPKKVVYYIDEWKTEETMLNLILLTDIAIIKIQGKLAGHQVMIYLKRSGGMLSNARPLNNSMIAGYAATENFISPDYSDSFYSNWKTDNREILFWGNAVQSDTTGPSVPIRFYNNDDAKKFRIVIMSISADGIPQYEEEIL